MAAELTGIALEDVENADAGRDRRGPHDSEYPISLVFVRVWVTVPVADDELFEAAAHRQQPSTPFPIMLGIKAEVTCVPAD